MTSGGSTPKTSAKAPRHANIREKSLPMSEMLRGGEALRNRTKVHHRLRETWPIGQLLRSARAAYRQGVNYAVGGWPGVMREFRIGEGGLP